MELLERHIDIAIETSNGVKRLRNLILSLAIRGKLVPQDLNDQPTRKLLKEIEILKTNLVKDGKIKKQKPLPPIEKDEIPYAVPEGWEWVRLGTCMLKITDGTHHSPPNAEDGDFLYISAKNIKDDGVMLENATYVTKKIHEEIFSRCDPEYGDLLYIKDGATTGITTINNLLEPFSMLSSVALLKPPQFVFNKYLFFSLKSPLFYSEMRSAMTGVAITRVTLQKLHNAIIPLPPLAEQKRIVAKIVQLMTLCDKLEIEQNAINNKLRKINTAVITNLLSASDKISFDTSWHFISKNFRALYSVPENVKELKKVILQLAIMGKLVPQEPNDQPASELLKEIGEEKKRLMKEGKIKNQAPLLPIRSEEIPFKVPDGWEWVRLREVGKIFSGNSLNDQQKNLYSKSIGGLPYISTKHVSYSSDSIDYSGEIVIPENENNFKVAHKNALLICSEGGSAGKKIGIIDRDVFFGNKLIANEVNSLIDVKLIYYIYNSSYFQNIFKTKMTGIIGGIPFSAFLNILIPLPPVAEQKRIVAKVVQLLFLCNKLEQELKHSSNKQAAIFNAVLAKI